jgi:pimeloyl-ACP methyl ester carboxylesterase
MRYILLFCLACNPRMDPPPAHCEGAESVHVETADGAEIALHRHAAPGPPVLLIHGISSNHRFWDLTEDQSMALILAEAGFDPWLMDLRGHGDAVFKGNGERQRNGWSVDDYGIFDLHAAIEHIQAQTGQERVAVVGHSMGGMVAAIYQAQYGDDALAAVVVVGTPATFDTKGPKHVIERVSTAVGALPRSLGIPTVARWMAGWQSNIPAHGEGLLFTASNMTPHMYRLMLRNIVSPTSREEVSQLERMLASGSLTSADGKRNYSAELSSLTVPFMAISGGGDLIVPPKLVEAWMDQVGSDDKTLIEASRSNGFAADYGHLDLALGPAAPREILRPVAEWLSQRRNHW